MESSSLEDSLIDLDKTTRTEYSDVFQDPRGLPPRHPHLGTMDFKICLPPSAVLPYRPPYRMTPMEHEEYYRQSSEFLKKGDIRESQLPFAVPVLFVPKTQLEGNDKELRMVID
jgi:hypothetical protein